MRTNWLEATESLEAVEVKATSIQKHFGASTSISAHDITKLPVNGCNFTTLMDFSPISRRTSTTPAVPGFDSANQRFNYRINTAGVVTPSGNPYQFQLGLRYSF